MLPASIIRLEDIVELLLDHRSLLSEVAAAAGVLVFCLAPYLPSIFPPAVPRLVGFATVCASLMPLWVLSESWLAPALLGGACLALMVAAHLLQTRRRTRLD